MSLSLKKVTEFFTRYYSTPASYSQKKQKWGGECCVISAFALKWTLKIREKKRKHASNCSNSTATHPKAIEGPSTGLSTGSSFPPNQPFFRMQSFRGRQPQPADKCFSCGQRGLWANSSVSPSRFRGSVPAVPNSKMGSLRELLNRFPETRAGWVWLNWFSQIRRLWPSWSYPYIRWMIWITWQLFYS